MVYPAGWITKLQSALALTINFCCTYVLHLGALAPMGPLTEMRHADLLMVQKGMATSGRRSAETCGMEYGTRVSMAESHKQGTKEEIWNSCGISEGEQPYQSKFFQSSSSTSWAPKEVGTFPLWVSVTYLDASLETEFSGKSVLSGGCWALDNLACSFSQYVVHLF